MERVNVKYCMCPNCGAPIENPSANSLYTCLYCGSLLYIGSDLHTQLINVLRNILRMRQAEEASKADLSNHKHEITVNISCSPNEPEQKGFLDSVSDFFDLLYEVFSLLKGFAGLIIVIMIVFTFLTSC